MTRLSARCLWAGGLLLFTAAARASAQGAGTESIATRIQRLADNGNAAAGRALADSIIAGAKPGSVVYVDALFARASIATSPDSARKDYLRIVVDYSMSPREEDALLKLAQMELSHGDRAAARQYLERLALEHPEGPLRAAGALQLGRLLLEEGEVLPACASLAAAKQRIDPANVELVNQVNYSMLPCAAAQHAADSVRADSVEKAIRADSVARADSVEKAKADAKKKKAAAAKAAAAAAVAARNGWSAQVAAYDTQAAADRLEKKLKDQGYEARVSSEKPFRVRVGWFSRRDDAVELVAKLKQAKIDAIVVEAEKP
jgi:cell division septation protein DedD